MLAALAVAGCGGGGTSRELHGGGPALGSLAGSGAGHRFFEIYEPDGPPRGTMLILHGGAWKDHRGDARRMEATTATVFRGDGWRVLNVSYSPGPRPRGRPVDPRPMLRDVVAFYDQAHRVFPGPVCVYGESAGGHLAALLAIERPTLTCAILAAAPFDLATLRQSTLPELDGAMDRAFGRSKATLDAWSPTQLWSGKAGGPAIFATAATNDTVVPAAQLTRFSAIAPEVDAKVVPGARAGTADAVPWMHSAVRRGAITARLADLVAWLQDRAPRSGAPAPPPATDVGATCDVRTSDRSRLLLAGDAWRPSSAVNAPIVATRGCSGASRWQDDGLSVWAFPNPGTRLAAGAEAALTLTLPHPARKVGIALRGFLRDPAGWAVGLYASTAAKGTVATPVAACLRGRCARLRLVRTRGGALLAPAGSSGDPDARDAAPAATLPLAAGTKRIALRLRCVASAGCALAPGTPRRKRDPLGHPAILSVYHVQLG